MYKISFDGKTIEKVPLNVNLFNYIKEKTKCESVVKKSAAVATKFNILHGETVKLNCEMKNGESKTVFVGINLHKEDFDALYTSIGTLVKD